MTARMGLWWIVDERQRVYVSVETHLAVRKRSGTLEKDVAPDFEGSFCSRMCFHHCGLSLSGGALHSASPTRGVTTPSEMLLVQGLLFLPHRLRVPYPVRRVYVGWGVLTN